MMGVTHLLVGGLTWGALTTNTHDLIPLAATLLGSIAPDIDGDGMIARPGRFTKTFLPRPLRKLLNSITTFLSLGVRLLLGHRGFLHSPCFLAMLLLAESHVQSEFLWWFIIGYATHLVADFLTPLGIPLLSPLSRQRTSIPLVHTGGLVEKSLFFLGFSTSFLKIFKLI